MVSPTFIRPFLSFLIAFSILLVVSSGQDTSAENGDIRTKFDSIISDWQQENQTLAPQFCDDDIESLFQRLFSNSTTTNRSQQLRDTEKHSRARELYKRQNVTASELAAARALVANAQVQQGKVNNQTLSNPRRNVYTKKPSGSTTQTDSILSAPLTADADLANAVVMVAEADAAILAQQGKLFKDYTLPGKYDKYNFPGTPTGNQHDKRATSDWFLPAVASAAPGSLPFSGSTTPIWRNVMNYGALGNGVHDDTAAINAALNDGCGDGCTGITTKGAAVYLPPGTYLVSTPIILEYNTQLIGDATSLSVIMAAKGFIGLGVISSDVYIPGASGATWYLDTDNFYRQARNLVIDIAECTTANVSAIHWQVAQATSLQNIQIQMSTSASTTQVGIYAENGSGGFMSDILVIGGNYGMQCGNQQFTTRNMIFYESVIRIYMIWDWC